MKTLLTFAVIGFPLLGAEPDTSVLRDDGLHGYIGFSHEPAPANGGYNAGMGFYAAVWSLIDRPGGLGVEVNGPEIRTNIDVVPLAGDGAQVSGRVRR